ncbi:type I-D CRISPR-associated helicase Cas3' [Salinibaculum rarum]|uniref:type I-D CRISPR-associated helicase Cas3' n=1 Tax=Salinibaculum rarum TaxID=3058903 RepID=UPI00265FBCD4|nr:type I-D CRISPR-associated helicase Cas3' [Salinibaculum sp. KK48]
MARDNYEITASAVETTSTPYNFPFSVARDFQADALEWLHNGDNPAAAMVAPTGSGKTAVFSQIAAECVSTLIVYPTNALLNQQQTVLAESDPDITAKVVTADTLDKHGHARTEELRNIMQSRRYDAVLTNPDILQAVLQGMYLGSGQEFQIFDAFDAVIYDEFHYYDPLAASGILMQLDVFAEKTANKLLLSSATPDESFIQYVADTLETPVTRISASYTDPTQHPHGQFRYETTCIRHSDQLSGYTENRIESFHTVANLLNNRLDTADDTSNPRAAVIFNSAAVSNHFHTFLTEEYPAVAAVAEKDNGYDTDSAHELADEFFILNTTSKGEVGLHFDLDLLIMETPATGYQFIQRFGRAGRESPATVHVFGTGEVGWPEEITYEEFVEHVYETFETPLVDQQRLSDLLGLRAALAVKTREDDAAFSNPVMYDLFESKPEYDRWRGFCEAVDEELHAERGFLEESPDSAVMDVLEVLDATFEGVQSLRGETLQCALAYPRGEETVATSYDLVSALQQYSVKATAGETVVVGGESEGVVVEYPGVGVCEAGSQRELDEQIVEVVDAEIRSGDWSSVAVREELVRRAATILPWTSVLSPVSVQAGTWGFTVGEDGSVEYSR